MEFMLGGSRRREWFWLLGQHNRLPRRKGAWGFSWNKESRMGDHKVQRFQSLVSTGHCSDSILTGTWRAGSCLVFTEPPGDGWLSSHPFSHLSTLILDTKLEFILVLVSHWIVSYLGTMAMFLSFGIPQVAQSLHTKVPSECLPAYRMKSGDSRLDWRSRQNQGNMIGDPKSIGGAHWNIQTVPDQIFPLKDLCDGGADGGKWYLKQGEKEKKPS